jgi:hypothetical protein
MMTRRFLPFLRPAVAVAAAVVFSGCATLLPPGLTSSQSADAEDAAKTGLAAAQAASTAGGNRNAGGGSGTSAVAAAAAAAAAVVSQGQPRPFADVVKDAREIPGYFRLWQRDERLWIEIAPEQFDVPFLFELTHARGVGEKGVYGGMMGFSHVARFKRVGNNVQLIATNHAFIARDGTPMARMVKEAFSDSLLAYGPVLSQPHPERKSVLVEVNPLLLNDLPAASRFAQGVYQRGYMFDSRNSSIEKTYASADQVSFTVRAHYANPKAGVAAAMGVPASAAPFENLPDTRSLFLGLQYTIAQLPEPMRGRVADPRIGHFTSEIWDFTDDLRYTARKHFVTRWRLEKKDPAAEISEPVKPITFWIDRNVPDRYRAAVREGILEWNKAFERIGFRNAIVVEQQPDDAEFETADVRHATVRWFAGTDVGFAIGPSEVDPRTGEILDADVAIPENWSRGDRRFLREDVATAWPAELAKQAAASRQDMRFCSYATAALDETQFALELLGDRGEIDADGPEVEAFVMGALKDVVMHEIGHALGLRHNFRGSTAYPLEKLADRSFTAAHGLAGTVMDYAPVNLALKGEQQGEYHQSTLGPYDYWAIEYAYKPLDAASEEKELLRIAARGSTDPALAFSSDEESASGIDPAASQFDFGSDSLAYLDRRFRLTGELWTRLQSRQLQPGQPYDVLRRTFDSGLRQTLRAAQVASKYVSGVTYVRDFAGTGRNPLTPVPVERQRAALRLLTDGIFDADSFQFRPEFLQRMGVDYLMVQWPNANPDFSLASRVLALQSGALGQLMNDAVATRLLDSETKVADPQQALHLAELYDHLHAAIWSELRTGRDINLLRRNLQRDHLTRVVSALLRPSATLPADARALLREEARTLRAEVAFATTLKKTSYSKEARAHLAETLATLDEALRAPIMRQGV